MQPRNYPLFEKIERCLFVDENEVGLLLNESEQQQRLRWQLTIAYWQENVSVTKRQVLDFLQFGCGGVVPAISRRQAYNEYSYIGTIISGLQLLQNKEWYRYRVIEMCNEAFQTAQKQGDAKAMALAADKLGKYTRCDQVDEETLDFTQFIPPSFEPTADISVLGLKEIPNLEQRRRELRRLYGSTHTIEEAEEHNG